MIFLTIQPGVTVTRAFCIHMAPVTQLTHSSATTNSLKNEEQLIASYISDLSPQIKPLSKMELRRAGSCLRWCRMCHTIHACGKITNTIESETYSVQNAATK